MRSRLHELLKSVVDKGVDGLDSGAILEAATKTKEAGIIDISKGLPSKIKFSVGKPSTSMEFFEDGALTLKDFADEAVRKQVQTYVAGANILIAAIRGGLSGDPTAMLSVVNSVVDLMSSVSDN